MVLPGNSPLAANAPLRRRQVLAGALATTALMLPGCASYQRYSLVEAIRRLLTLSARNALARLMAPGGFWDNQLARLPLPEMFGSRGTVIQQILGSAPVRHRLQRELNHVAEHGARRAAPVIADTVRVIGIENAEALVRGGPTAATGFMQGAMAGSLVDVMLPALGDGLRLAQDPLVGQAIEALSGVDVTGVARALSQQADAAIWAEIGREEAAIRADPIATNDPVLIGVFGLAGGR